MMKTNLGEKIKYLREEKELTQPQLAKKLKVSNGIISMWENNLAEPKSTYLKMLATFFDVTMEYLLDDEDDEYEYNFEYEGNGATLKHKERKQNTQNEKDTTNTVQLFGRNGETKRITVKDEDMYIIEELLKKFDNKK